MKLFDYKFLITLGLCLMVYLLYKEIDLLSKRITQLELEKAVPKKCNIASPSLIEAKVEDEIVNKTVEEPQKSNKMVEEYSNDNNIYSHDNLNTNTNDQDTMMLESILDMVNSKENDASGLQHDSESSDKEIVELSIQEDMEEINNIDEENKEVNEVNRPNEEHTSSEEIKLIKQSESKLSLDALNKKKLDELHELASKYNIDINNEQGKKKKKAELADEIFNKQ
jgi:hypothetical protein